MKNAIGKLPTSGIISLLERLKDEMTIGYLLYQLAMNEIGEKDYEDAASALAELTDRFPDHEYAQDAETLFQELRNNYIYSRYTLGCLLPLSGPYQLYGHRALKGIELAMNRFSAENPDLPLRLIVKDSGSDPQKAVLQPRVVLPALFIRCGC